MAKRKTRRSVARVLEAADQAGLEAALREAQGETRLLQRELARARQIGREVADAAKALSLVSPWRSKTGPRPEAPITMLALVSDMQAGERVEPRETEGWGRFNRAILEMRVRYYAACVKRFAETQRHGYRLDDLVVVVLGDLVSGDIHEELTRTNEVDPPVQAIEAGRLLAFFVRDLAGSFARVRVEMIGGSNHSRLSKKYQFKRGALNSFDYVAHEYARGLLQNQANVTTRHHAGRSTTIEIAGYRFRCGHGDGVMGWLGFPWYGVARKIRSEAFIHMKAMLQQVRRGEKVTRGFDYALGGHWHTPVIGPNQEFIINGSFTGTTELDVAKGRYAEPQQVTALLSPKHGLFASVAWQLAQEEEKAHVKDRWVVGEEA